MKIFTCGVSFLTCNFIYIYIYKIYIIFIAVSTPSRFHSHYRYILLHPPTDCFPAEDYPSLSSPFTYALLLSYLTCKEHLFGTLLVLFISLFSFFLFLFICFMPVSLLFFLLPHYGFVFQCLISLFHFLR